VLGAGLRDGNLYLGIERSEHENRDTTACTRIWVLNS
jgi:hypothetical protein